MKIEINSLNVLYSSISIIRVIVITIFFISGNLKWFPAEMSLVSELTMNSWLSFLPGWFGMDGSSYFLAIFEAFVCIALLSGFTFPAIGIIASLAVMFSSIVMLSLVHFPLDSIGLGILLNQTVLFGCGLTLFFYDFSSCRINQRYVQKYFKDKNQDIWPANIPSR